MFVVPVIHYGLGPIGRAIGRAVSEESRLVSVGAIDIDSTIVGRFLNEVCDVDLPHIVVASRLSEIEAPAGAVILLATVSRLEQLRPFLLEGIARGYHIVSTSEELVWPAHEHPAMAAEIDEAARKSGVTVLGVGVNPGLVMDTLPVLMSRAASAVEAVHVSRTVNLSERRAQLQRKMGVGEDPAHVQDLLDEEALGHVGLSTSLNMLAAGVGWKLDVIDLENRPLVADAPRESALGSVPAGRCVGVNQRATGYVEGVPRIILKLVMELDTEGGSHDEILIDGDQCLRLRIDGLHGDLATAALVAKQAVYVSDMPAGLHTMLSAPILPEVKV